MCVNQRFVDRGIISFDIQDDPILYFIRLKKLPYHFFVILFISCQEQGKTGPRRPVRGWSRECNTRAFEKNRTTERDEPLNQGIESKSVDVLLAINRALTSLRLYPATSTIVSSAVDSLYRNLLAVFDDGVSELIFAESEKSLLINGEKLPLREQEKPQMATFLRTMFNFGLKSAGFNKGVNREQLLAFLEILSSKPGEYRGEKALETALKERGVRHIAVDKKIYVVKDGEHQLLARLEMTDADVIRYLTGAAPEIPLDMQRIRAMAQDPQWLTNIFQSGLAAVMQGKGVRTDAELAQRLVKEIGLLEGIVHQADREQMSREVVRSITELDSSVVGEVLMHGVDNMMGGQLFSDIVTELEEDKFWEVAEQVRRKEAASGSRMDERTSLYRRLMSTDKGRALMERRQTAAQDDERVCTLQDRLQAIIDEILSGSALSSREDSLEELWKAMDDMVAADEIKGAAKSLYRLGTGLQAENPLQRNLVAEALAGLLGRLPGKMQIEILGDMDRALALWVEVETLATVPYKKLCYGLKDLIQWRIQTGEFEAILPVLHPFYCIYHGIWEKNDTAHAVASDIIRILAARDNLDHLFDVFDKERDDERKASVGTLLTRLDEASLNRLLDRLRDERDSQPRVRILQILTEAGSPAVPSIRARIDRNEPWYFLRNLAYLLGRIKGTASAEALTPFLLHDNEKVSLEALKSIHRLGAKDGGPVLLSILPRMDESLQVRIVEELGHLRYAPAVPQLIGMLQDRSFIVSAQRADLEEKLCFALGRIGAAEAVPVLQKISHAGFFSLRKYDEKVKAAAARALGGLRA